MYSCYSGPRSKLCPASATRASLAKRDPLITRLCTTPGIVSESHLKYFEADESIPRPDPRCRDMPVVHSRLVLLQDLCQRAYEYNLRPPPSSCIFPLSQVLALVVLHMRKWVLIVLQVVSSYRERHIAAEFCTCIASRTRDPTPARLSGSR